MQVVLHTSTLTNNGGLAPSSVKPQRVVSATPGRLTNTFAASEYPASPLLTTRPQRYSVQLNDQLTSLQQADSYLSMLEQKLLDYRHASLSGGRLGRDANAAPQAAAIQSLLEKRTKLTGGAVDRQLMPVLQGEAMVSFQAPDLSGILSGDNRPESLLFSVHDGRGTQHSAVSVSDNTDAHQYATLVNNALRRVGVYVGKGREANTLTAKESHWSQLEQSFSVMGEGHQFSAKSKTKLTVMAHPAASDRLAQALSAGGWGAAQGGVQDTLRQLGEQRELLAAQQEKARQLIDGMVRFPETQSAIQASCALSTSLEGANHNFDVLVQAVNGQANLSKLTVRSILR